MHLQISFTIISAQHKPYLTQPWHGAIKNTPTAALPALAPKQPESHHSPRPNMLLIRSIDIIPPALDPGLLPNATAALKPLAAAPPPAA
jgi:hypothetical protein